MGGAISDLVSRVNNLELLLKDKKSAFPTFSQRKRLMAYNEQNKENAILPTPVDGDNNVIFYTPEPGLLVASVVWYKSATATPALWVENAELAHSRLNTECSHCAIVVPTGTMVKCENVVTNYFFVDLYPLKSIMDS